MRIFANISTFIFTILITTLSSASSSQPLSEYSALIARLQKTYAENADYPIFIVDRNEIEWEMAKRRLFGETQREKRLAFLEEYFERKTGRDINFNDAVNIEIYVNILVDSAFSLRLHNDDMLNPKTPKVCLVFPAPENSNQRLETERVLALNTPGVYGSLGYDNLRVKLSYEELRLFSLLHEIGHCLDRKFAPGSVFAGGENSHDIHLSESFAETFAALAMVREGYTKVAVRRAHMRIIYSRMIGPYLAANPQIGLGSPTFMDGGVIYHLYPVLRAANVEIQASAGRLGTANVEDLIHLAERIVDQNALTYRTFSALTYLMKNGREEALQRYEEMAKESPEFFSEAIIGLQNYLAVTDRVLKFAFDQKAKPAKPRGRLSSIRYKELCDDLNADDTQAFFSKVNLYRSELRSAYGTPEEQRERAKALNWLMKEVSELCADAAAPRRLI